MALDAISPEPAPVRFSSRRALVGRLNGVYAVVNADARATTIVAAALAAGIRIVQYRAKRGIDSNVAKTIRALTEDAGALFLLNDDWRSVRRYRADGVHLGPDDAAPAELPAIREALGEAILGVSCGTVAEAREAGLAADYLGVGAVFATSSKYDAGEPIGIAGLARIVAATPLPVAAIGGIDEGRIAAVRAAGAAMAAVISAIAVPEVERACRQLVCAWGGEK